MAEEAIQGNPTSVCDDCYHEIVDQSVQCECMCHQAYITSLVNRAESLIEMD
ncbi:MAG: hypothetical protein JRM77_06635 [Nitrososphaerota archaeon]|nr:hypothetical protein [Nitrososphaerota archaeon]